MLASDRRALEPAAADIAREQPELEPAFLDPRAVRAPETGLGNKLWGCRLETGWPVRPAAATLAFAARARRAGAVLHEGRTAWPWVMGGGPRGVLAAGAHCPAGAVLVAAGPWTPEVIDPTRAWRPIAAVWGVVVEMHMDDPPRHVVEEVGVEEVSGRGPRGQAAVPDSIFSLVAAGGLSSVGSTFLSPRSRTPSRGCLACVTRRALGARSRGGARRGCACLRAPGVARRPSAGRPRGRGGGPGVAAGHGPWGISTGPATARLAADALLGREEVPAVLRASRFGRG